MAEVISELDITALVHGGRGLGHYEGKAVFVPLTVPGDRVSCRVVNSKRRYIEADILELLVASPLRRQPPCPYFGLCGGCQWQQIPYIEQARWKEQIYSDLLVRSKIACVDALRPIVSAPREWGYRNRVQLKCHGAADGLVLGFYRQGSHYVIDVDACQLVTAQIQGLLNSLRKSLPEAPCQDCIPQVDIACAENEQVRMILHSLPRGRNPLRSWLLEFARAHEINACIQSGRKETLEVVHGDADLTITVDEPEILLRYGPGGFVQVNTAQNRNMVMSMLGMLNLNGTEKVLDLFCGMGNFSLPLARHSAWVIGVEDYAPSIDNARNNALANNIRNIEFHAADATHFMKRFHAEELDLVVLDPPRTGCYPVACELLKLRPKRILYVSCDPATLARDLVPLVQGGYEIVIGQPFDFFPQTWHIESMTLLSRRADA
jgi:23S rRNA (uracil1939-C5)-methyltransferase